jgi:hypothetical protein
MEAGVIDMSPGIGISREWSGWGADLGRLLRGKGRLGGTVRDSFGWIFARCKLRSGGRCWKME